MYTIRLYCNRFDKKELSRYEITETQILRFKSRNTVHVRFKMYDYCKNYYSTNRPLSWLRYHAPNNRMSPNMYETNSDISSISLQINDTAGNTIHQGVITGMIGGKFDIMVPPLTKGNYTLLVTYTTIEDDVVTRTFPIVITN